MASIFPFCGWRYSKEAGDITSLTSPIYDLTEDAIRKKQYLTPYNIIHLSVPEDLCKAEAEVQHWKDNKIIVQDTTPSIYAYSQTFRTVDNREHTNQGFIANIQLHEWKEQVVLRHEMTIPRSVGERELILQKTKLHLCPTHGLYTDNNNQLEEYIEESLQNPVYSLTDSSGVLNKLSIIQDKIVIKKFIEVLKGKQIILADGHHRYEASLQYRKNQLINGNNSLHALDYHPMYLTNTESNDLIIHPTHRLFHSLENFNKTEIIQKLINFFRVKSIEDPYKLLELIDNRKHSFGIVFQDEAFVLELKEGLEKEISWSFPEIIKELDLTILHYFIVEKALKIEGKNQKNSKNINFSFNFTNTVNEVKNGNHQMAVITREISKEEIKKVCYSGYTLPQKSTYFYPKVLCGLVMSSVNDLDFQIEKKLYQKEMNI